MPDPFSHDARPVTPTGPTRSVNSQPFMHPLNTDNPRHHTFFDDDTPVDSTNVRDSHDLSFAEGANARHSVVDNMLLSLDQFASGNMLGAASPHRHGGLDTNAGSNADDFFLRDASYRPPGTRHRTHTYTSSRSSDYEMHTDDAASRYAAHHSRTRRSNSSNNIASPTRAMGSARDPYSVRSTNGLYGQYQQNGHLRGAGKQGSKGSGSSSMDFGHSGILGTHRLGFGKRSTSFDHGNMAGIPSVRNESVLERGRTAYQNWDSDYDAAPEPTIPAGPRRPQQQQQQQQQLLSRPHSPGMYSAQPSYVPPQAPTPHRRGSVRSNTSYQTLRKGKSPLDADMRAQAQEFVNASTLRDLPAIPTFQDPPAPAPAVATRKAMFTSQDPIAAPKDIKPGFFRRVFGGGSSKPQSAPAVPQTANAAPVGPSPASTKPRPVDVDSMYSQNRPRTTPNYNSHIANQLRSLPKPPPTADASQSESQAPPLAKKPSSFFRRRKKSIENTKPPVMSLDFTPPPRPTAVLPQPSPGVSSLRQIMNPYLNDAAAPSDKFHDSVEHHVAEGDKPHKEANLRAADSTDDSSAPSSQGGQAKSSQPAPAGERPKLKLKVKANRPTVPTPQEDTFLADSSSNEDHSGRATPVGDPSSVVETRRSASPTCSSLNQTTPTGKSQSKARQDPRAELLAPDVKVTSSSGSVSEAESWIIAPRTQDEKPRAPSPGAKRVWLDTTLAEESPIDTGDDLQLPMEGARSFLHPSETSTPISPTVTSPLSANDVFHSATSLPILQVENRDSDTMPSIVDDRLTRPSPTDADRERALKIYNGNDSSLPKAQAAAVLGDVTLSSLRTRKAFMDLFEWSGFTILAAMRDMCSRLLLKAETQQVDRILMSLSERWCECNPNHGFKEVGKIQCSSPRPLPANLPPDVVHTICYSILLLNTDLHVADIETRMTRSQFVRNTLPTVTRVCQDAIKAEETMRPKSTQFKRGSLPWHDKSEPDSPNAEQTAFSTDAYGDPAESKRARSRLSVRPPLRSGSDGLLSFDSVASDSNTLVNTPYNGPIKGWELQIELVLKEFYESIRKQRLPLHGAPQPTRTIHEQPSSNNLSVSGMLRRTPSVLSKAPSDNASYRGRSQPDFRSSRWASKNRSKQRLYPSSTVASSRTSLDDGSVWSPAGSSSWSRYSYGKTGTSMSIDSLGSHFATGDYQQSIGFANALSQAIIREEGMTISSDEEFTRVAPLLEDESLELVGAPWAKEGILKHKHHLETVDRKAKDRAWSENFAVIEKGYMRLFSFSMNSKSMRNKNKLRPSPGSVVGGGNWMDNAEALESFPLRQTIASALPPPGYSKTRPHVWALSLPTGAVHLFQVGTPDIVREFVTTANYWSARLSKEPLTGGVSSMEYGWGENVINPALLGQENVSSVQGHMPRPSMASSLRSSMDQAAGAPRPRLPGDKITLSDWSPPTSSMMASNLMEVDQLRALTDYVKNIEGELAHHNELRAPLLITVSRRRVRVVVCGGGC